MIEENSVPLPTGLPFILLCALTDGAVPTISAAKAAISRCLASRSSSFDNVGMDGRDAADDEEDEEDEDDDDEEEEDEDGIDGGGPMTNATLPTLAWVLTAADDGEGILLSNKGTCGRRSLPLLGLAILRRT